MIRWAKPVEVVPDHWRVEATMPCTRLIADMSIAPDAVDRMPIEEVLDLNEFLDVRADAAEAVRQAEEAHARKQQQIEHEGRAKPANRPTARSMVPRRPR